MRSTTRSRLISAATTGPEWGLSFAYHGFGNRANQTVAAPASALSFDANNRLATFDQDHNGNVTWDDLGDDADLRRGKPEHDDPRRILGRLRPEEPEL